MVLLFLVYKSKRLEPFSEHVAFAGFFNIFYLPVLVVLGLSARTVAIGLLNFFNYLVRYFQWDEVRDGMLGDGLHHIHQTFEDVNNRLGAIILGDLAFLG